MHDVGNINTFGHCILGCGAWWKHSKLYLCHQAAESPGQLSGLFMRLRKRGKVVSGEPRGDEDAVISDYEWLQGVSAKQESFSFCLDVKEADGY